jgi:hypothetical protein
MLTLALLSCRGNPRDTTQKSPCPITIQGLAALHNSTLKLKLAKVEDNLSEYLQKCNKKAKWSVWTEYAQKNVSRCRVIQQSDRLEPVTEGEDEISLNFGVPGLYLTAQQTKVTTIKCSLVPNKEGVSFASLFETAHKTLSTTNLGKTTIDALYNFHRLVYVET